MVLSESSDLNALALEEGLGSAARWATPVFRELSEQESRGDRVGRVPGGFVVAVPTGAALVDAGV